MPRVVSLYLPNWPIDRWRRENSAGPSAAEAPFVLTLRVGARRIVAAASPAALAGGAAAGMPAAHAGAVVPGLRLLPHDAAADEAALEALARRMTRRFSPVVAIDPPDGLRLEASGVAHLFGGEEAMLARIAADLHGLGIACRAAMAETYGAAHALARFAASPAIAHRDASFAALPLAALRLSAPATEALVTLGFETVGALRAAPRASLTLRFGDEIASRLDQLYGDRIEPCLPVSLPDIVAAERSFAEPVGTPEALAHVIHELSRQAGALLAGRHLGARRADLCFHRIDGRIETIRIGFARPTRDPRPIGRLLLEHLTTIDPGLGVEKIALRIPWAEPLELTQTGCAFGETARPDLSTLADTLSNRLGADRVYRLQPVESDVPERSIVRVPAMAAASALPWPAKRQPCRLLSRPHPVETIALLPDHPPRQFTWKDRRHVVRHADGPERIFGEWWRRETEIEAVRDYFEVEDEEGARFWLYRSGDGVDPCTGSGKWFLHGFFQ